LGQRERTPTAAAASVSTSFQFHLNRPIRLGPYGTLVCARSWYTGLSNLFATSRPLFSQGRDLYL